AAAAGVIGPKAQRIEPIPGAPTVPTHSFSDRDRANEWYDDERGNLVAAVRRAADLGLDEYTWRLGRTLQPDFYLRGLIDHWLVTEELALAATQRVGNRQAEADTLTSLAVAHRRIGDSKGAIDYHEKALIRYRELNDQRGVMTTLTELGIAYRRLGRYRDAL